MNFEEIMYVSNQIKELGGAFVTVYILKIILKFIIQVFMLGIVVKFGKTIWKKCTEEYKPHEVETKIKDLEENVSRLEQQINIHLVCPGKESGKKK